MKPILTLAFIFLLVHTGISQVHSKQDLVQCMELAFAQPDMNKIVEQEWGEVRDLYIVSAEQQQIRPDPFIELLSQLEPQDFQGFPYEVTLITNTQRDQLDFSDNEIGSATIQVFGNFRGNVLSMTIGGPVPGNLRQHLLGSFVFEKEEEGWKIIQSQAFLN